LCLSRRADFEYCDARGLSAAEYNPQGAAAAEIEKLYVLLQAVHRVAESGEGPFSIPEVNPEAFPETRPEPLGQPETSESTTQSGTGESVQPKIPDYH
jgi:hypothetical protein